MKMRLTRNNKIYYVSAPVGDANPTLNFSSTKQQVDIAKIEETNSGLKITIESDKTADFQKALDSRGTTNDYKAAELEQKGLEAKATTYYFYEESKDTYFGPSFKNYRNRNSFKYTSGAFGLQALTLPLKFRRGIGDHTKLPPTVETGFNIGFAAGYKNTLHIYKPDKNFLGKNTTQLSFTPGICFGLGSTDLDPATNSPGLLSKRKSPLLSYGGFVMFGVNNINIGYALGWDNVRGEGRKYWAYQNRLWQGVIVALDILKF